MQEQLEEGLDEAAGVFQLWGGEGEDDAGQGGRGEAREGEAGGQGQGRGQVGGELGERGGVEVWGAGLLCCLVVVLLLD